MSISKIKDSAGTSHDIIASGVTYCTCSTAAGTAAKVATVVSGSFTLFTGATVIVKFTNANSVASPTLNVGGTGAKPIYIYGTTTASTGTTTTGWVAGAVQMFTYDGTGWIRDYWNNTTYSAAGSSLGLVKSGGDVSISSGVITVNDDSHNHSAANITSGTMAAARLPTASGSAAGITIVYPAASCTTFSDDSGTVTPLAVQKGAKMFAITRPDSSTNKAITRYSNTTGDVQDSTIIIEDVTNTRDSSQAQVIAVPASGDKKMVYGYCTDQVDGTSFIGGIFPADATEYPYSQGLAIGGSSGNLLWKGAKVATTGDIPSSLKSPYSLTIQGNGTTLTNGTYDGSAAKTVNITPSAIGAATSSHNHAASNITSGTLSSDRLPTVPIAKGGTGATTAAAALTNLGITATAAELNYVDGVTSNIQTQLNSLSSEIDDKIEAAIGTAIAASY